MQNLMLLTHNDYISKRPISSLIALRNFYILTILNFKLFGQFETKCNQEQSNWKF